MKKENSRTPIGATAQLPALSSRETTLSLLRVLLYIIMVVCYCQGILWDASRHVPMSEKFSELSFTEFSQSVLLGLGCIIMLFARARYQVFRIGSFIIAMFLLVSLFRENDYWLDFIHHGVWEYPVAIAAIPTLYYTFKERSALFAEMKVYFNTRAFGLFLAGFLATYVFSRLLGRGVMWEAALGDHYLRVVKDAVEESSESCGYLLMFFSTIEFTALARKLRRS